VFQLKPGELFRLGQLADLERGKDFLFFLCRHGSLEKKEPREVIRAARQHTTIAESYSIRT
jgi:hypothetical protein